MNAQITTLNGLRVRASGCGHGMCALLTTHGCCACEDKRGGGPEGCYARYVDGEGVVRDGGRYDHYCPPCKARLTSDRLAANGATGEAEDAACGAGSEEEEAKPAAALTLGDFLWSNAAPQAATQARISASPSMMTVSSRGFGTAASALARAGTVPFSGKRWRRVQEAAAENAGKCFEKCPDGIKYWERRIGSPKNIICAS